MFVSCVCVFVAVFVLCLRFVFYLEFVRRCVVWVSSCLCLCVFLSGLCLCVLSPCLFCRVCVFVCCRLVYFVCVCLLKQSLCAWCVWCW